MVITIIILILINHTDVSPDCQGSTKNLSSKVKVPFHFLDGPNIRPEFFCQFHQIVALLLLDEVMKVDTKYLIVSFHACLPFFAKFHKENLQLII